MSIHSEHMRLKPVLDLARKLDIATNPDPAAIFEAGSAGFQVWCTPGDHPKGWEGIAMIVGTFSKPCEFIGDVAWKWEDERITAVEISTAAYALADQRPDQICSLTDNPAGFKRRTIFNRDEDIEWLKAKATALFEQAGVDLLPFEYEQAPLSQLRPYTLAHYIAADGSEYVVLVSPGLAPQDFCQPGDEVTNSIEVWEAGEFPADMILRPELPFIEPDHDDEGPLTEQYENSSRMHDDDWLESMFEDRIGGNDE